MNVSLSDAYDEACKALGEAIVRERLLTREAERLSARVADLEAMPDPEVEPELAS